MAWTPTQTLLTTTDELVNLSFSISYVDDSTSEPAVVTITPIDVNPSIKVVNNTISGYFSEAFDYTLNYIDSKGTDYTVPRFSDINRVKLYELYKYSPNTTNSITYNYLATAKESITNTVLATQTYSIVVTQNWTTNKNLLKRFVDFDQYVSTYVVTSLNLNGNKVTFVNNLGDTVYLEKT